MKPQYMSFSHSDIKLDNGLTCIGSIMREAVGDYDHWPWPEHKAWYPCVARPLFEHRESLSPEDIFTRIGRILIQDAEADRCHET